MFEHLRGTIVDIGPTRLTLEVGGVGYAVQIPVSTYDVLAASRGREELIRTVLHVREDAWRLFGFATEDERTLFNMLQRVSGVGPSLALTLLSRASVSDIRDAILDERIDFLKSLKGIGPKTAKRLVNELADGVGILGTRPADGVHIASDEDDAAQALQVLGYTARSARAAVEKAKKKGTIEGVEALVRAALKQV